MRYGSLQSEADECKFSPDQSPEALSEYHHGRWETLFAWSWKGCLFVISFIFFCYSALQLSESSKRGTVEYLALNIWDDNSQPSFAPSRAVDRNRVVQRENGPTPIPTRRVERDIWPLVHGSESSPSFVPTNEPSRRLERHLFTPSPTLPDDTSSQSFQPVLDDFFYYYNNQHQISGSGSPVVVDASERQDDSSSDQDIQNQADFDGLDDNSVKPNIIFILADDLGWSSIGNNDYDGSYITPFLSSLAEHGIIMGQYYSQEMCTPARASLLTGKYPITVGVQRGGVQSDVAWGLDKDETTFPQILQR